MSVQSMEACEAPVWRVQWKDEAPGGTLLTEQVLAWLVTSQGRATAITVDAQGHVEDAGGADAFIPRAITRRRDRRRSGHAVQPVPVTCLRRAAPAAH
ncbi:hypothetical protein AB0I84_17640 [Streptomyces spectabilis]|uniref:hypothetical protein n=1 Tax=Streptomyces spectabilis TaxID=68270 RepID=UPI0033ED38BA